MEILKVQLDKVKTAGNELFGYRDKISVCQSNIETIYKNLRSKIVCENRLENVSESFPQRWKRVMKIWKQWGKN